MKKYSYIGKNLEDAINIAKADLQEVEDNLIIKEKSIQKKSLLKSSKVGIEVIEKLEVRNYLKKFLLNLLKNLGVEADIEVKNHDGIPLFIIYSDNDGLLIGKDGKNLKSLTILAHQHIRKEIDYSYKFLIDINSYQAKREKTLEKLAKQIAREVASTKVEIKLDTMNSYERRIIHNILANNKKVYTESSGEEPNRCVIIKPR